MQSSNIISIFHTLLFFLLFIPTAYNQCTDVTITTTTGNYSEEMSWELYDSDDILVASFQGASNFQASDTIVCLPDGCYALVALDTYGDGWNGGMIEMIWGSSTFSYELPDLYSGYAYFGVNATDCTPVILGCNDPEALNFDNMATVDDGSCLTLSESVALQVFDTLIYSGPKDNRINWVLQNRSEENPNSNYTGQADFTNLINEHLVARFNVDNSIAQTPYAQYKNFFNLYTAWWPDAPGDHSWWSSSVIQQMRDEVFLPWENEETGWAIWFSVSKYGGGGGAGRDREARVGDGKMWGADDYETLLHEFGHTMPGLPDEYTASGEWSNGNCWESGNTTSQTIKDSIPWRKWIEEDTPLPTPYTGENNDKIGAFEGALTNYFGCYRPTAKGCYMGAGGFGEGYGRNLCSPCVQRTICFLYKYVNVIENPIPANPSLSVSGAETLSFSADVIAPEPNTQKYEWFLNGKLVGADVTNIELTFGNCDNYELKFTVTDTTDLVRYDEQFDEIYPKPYREFVWNIEQEDVNSYNLSNSSVVTNANCTGADNGEVAFTFNGGLAPYEIWLEGVLVDNPVTNLAPGNHLFTLVDANGCSISESIQVDQMDLLDLEICSSKNGTWEVSVYTENYDPAALDLFWSTGETDPLITGLSDGNYSLTATINGCVVSENFELISSPEIMNVSHQSFPSETSQATGAIYLTVSGGTPIYDIHWYERIGISPIGPFVYNPEFDGHFSRSNLAPGEYRYEIIDASSACAETDITIETHTTFTVTGLNIVQDGNCGVAIESPNSAFEYYWLSDEQGTQMLGSGISFKPPFAGNFYVAVANVGTNGWSTNRKGFAVTMPEIPQVEDLGNGSLAIVNPQVDEIYLWYEVDACGAPIHAGTTFNPDNTSAEYFISAQSNIVYPNPIDPTSISGLVLQMDAADLNGDGQIDDPAPETSSLLDWYFPTGNQWTENWFPYRSNYQNGLGIVDWATLWLQRIDNPQNGFQTVIMAYDENELSWDNTAPFQALSQLMPRHSDASQLFANDAPNTTLNGSTFLNGQEVDPLNTANPMNFCILGTRLTNVSNTNINFTDMHWEGQVGEILFYDHSISDEEMKGITEHLRQKWISTAELESPRTSIQWGTVSTQEIDESLELSLSPNPTTDIIFLESNSVESLSIEIFDLQGRLVLSEASFISTTQLDVSRFTKGMYQLLVRDKKGKGKALRFIKM